MDLFVDDATECGRIAAALVSCHCCARCVLRYLGLKDMHSYRRHTLEMEEVVAQMMASPPDPDVAPNNGGDDTEGASMQEMGSDSSPTALASTNVEDSGNTLLEVNNAEANSDTNALTVLNGEANVKQTEMGSQLASGNVSESCPDGVVGQLTSETASPASLKTEFTDGQVPEKCSNITVQNNSKDTGCVNETESAAKNNIDISKAENDTVDSSSEGLSKSDAAESVVMTDSVVDRKETTRCVTCLGILKEFVSAEFLDEIKSCSRGSGFEFSSYICSLIIPVSVILREHSVLLFLKERFRNIYGNKTMSDIASVKDVWKWRNGPELREILGAAFDQKSSFGITLTFVYPDSDKECNFLLDVESDTFRNRKKNRRCHRKKKWEVFTRVNVEKTVMEMSDDKFRSNFQSPPTVPGSVCRCDIKCLNEPIYIAGRYNKYSRVLSQTPWIIEGTRKSESSVEELICTEVDKNFKPTEHKFSSSGREDVDVLMLGNGRPFVVELVNPKRVHLSQEEMTNIQTTINDATEDIKVQDLQIVSREATDKLKDGEIDKVKTYSALCWSASVVTETLLARLTDLKDLKILQKTPIRVLHRRPLATRDKLIHSMSVVRRDEHHFRVTLSTQAGTYIKEFIHGDFGRTRPSISDLLGVDCDIIELDVESVELDWPKKLG